MEPTGSELVARTKAGVRELREFVAALADDDLQRVVPGGWTIGAQLAHLAFWDRWVDTRWRLFERTGAFDDLPDSIGDLVNETAEPLWLVMPGALARELALGSAERVSRTIEALDATAIDSALMTGRPAMLDRTRHWHPHLIDIRSALTPSP